MMMTSVQLTEYGGTDKLAITEATGQAEPSEGQVLIRVTAAAINRVDAVLAAGYLSEVAPLELPVTMGGDFSGTVLQIGTGVNNVTVGKKVIGNSGVLLGGSGSFADHAVARARLVAKAPTSIDLPAAAALPLVGASAVQALQTLEARPGTTDEVCDYGVTKVHDAFASDEQNGGKTVIIVQ